MYIYTSNGILLNHNKHNHIKEWKFSIWSNMDALIAFEEFSTEKHKEKRKSYYHGNLES